MGLTTASYARLLRLAGFNPIAPPMLAEGAHGPVAPVRWRWRPPRHVTQAAKPPVVRQPRNAAFAALAGLADVDR